MIYINILIEKVPSGDSLKTLFSVFEFLKKPFQVPEFNLTWETGNVCCCCCCFAKEAYGCYTMHAIRKRKGSD